MALQNSLLVRYAEGYHVVEDAASIAAQGRHEGYLELGSAQSVDEVERIAGAILARSAVPAVATTAAVEPVGPADTPYTAFDVGDWITAPDETATPTLFRVFSIAYTEDDEGNPIFAPELRSAADEAEVRFARWLKRMSNGALGGSTESASVASPAPGFTPRRAGWNVIPTFSQSGDVELTDPGDAGKGFAQKSGRVVAVFCSLTAPSLTTSTILRVRKNGSDLLGPPVGYHELEIPPGWLTVYDPAYFDFDGPNADYFDVAVTQAGDGATGLVVNVLAV